MRVGEPESSCEAAPFEQRCTSLGLCVWQRSATGGIVGRAAPSPLRGLLAARPLLEHVEQCLATDVAPAASAPTQALPGCWMLPLVERHGSRRGNAWVVMLLENRVVDEPRFRAICADTKTVVAEMAGALLDSEAEAKRLAAVVRWSFEDLRREARDAGTLEQFSEKLSLAYEDSNLLFRLARLLNSTKPPSDLVQSVCDDLHQTMPFDWLAIQFHPVHTRVTELAGRLLTSGMFRLGGNELAREAAAFVTENRAMSSSVLDARFDPLAMAAGADVLTEPIINDGRLVGIIAAGNKRGPDSDISSEETQFVAAAANFLGIYHENSARVSEQKALFVGTLQALSNAIDAKDPYTCGHSDRVALLAAQLAAAIGLDTDTIERYRITGLVHDVGKIGVPEAVLGKPGRLTAEEFEQIKRHPAIGHGILKDIPLMREMLPGVLHHHERWDGRGYPAGLSGEQIPLIARVLALADTFDAMSSTRSYRPALSREHVLTEIQRCSGQQFDPSLVQVFVSMDFSQFDVQLEHARGATSFAA